MLGRYRTKLAEGVPCWIKEFLEPYPELAVLLAIALRYLARRIEIGEFPFWPVTGSLFAGLLIG